MAPLTHLTAFLGYTTLISALPNPLTLDYATFRGRSELLSGVDNFLGMPFAKASRLENPRLIGPQDALPGVTDATDYGPACPQHEPVSSSFYQENAQIGQLLGFAETVLLPKILRQDEDCLSINVQVPKGVTNISGLPVLMWIHAGIEGSLGSEATALQGVIYQGANIVRRSVQMGQPVIFVSANYRLNFFGTLSSKEITDAGVANLFLKDQDVAFEWIQKYIRQFGGDPTKVTVFGESAGAMSTTTHMVLNNGDVSKKFRAAWVFS
ncbi:putative carboxylesterase, type B, carboxylesterase type B, active, alpha/Beta hydrolase [Septoria linicola]|nr:putative carboxylesterase, type B, carboxylesterase type B, active, alpha/Beta hydrolase [Septoria linicola]